MNMMQQMGVLFTLEIVVNPAAPSNTEGICDLIYILINSIQILHETLDLSQ